ncbi:Uncharacterised protein [uncultured archaeon]|nr:Uncharacterised protein [uncultured archaeon]
MNRMSAIAAFGLIAPIVVIAISLITPRATTPMANATPNNALDVLPATTPMVQKYETGPVEISITSVATPTITPTPVRRIRGRGNRIVSSKFLRIEIDDMDNNVRYTGFKKGDPWNIIFLNNSTGALTNEFNSTIGETDGKDWFIWFGYVPRSEEKGIQYCIFPGSYEVYANASHNGILIEKTGDITVNSSEACMSPIPPVSELGTMFLTLTGLMMILLIYIRGKKR